MDIKCLFIKIKQIQIEKTFTLTIMRIWVILTAKNILLLIAYTFL